MNKTERRLFKRTMIVGLALTVAVIAFTYAGWLEPLENFLYDRRARWCQFYVRKPTDSIVHLCIDDASIDQHALGRFPWPRDKWAQLIDELRLAGPKVIALDVIFPDAENPENDAALAGAFRRAGNVVLGANLELRRERADAEFRWAVGELKRDLTVGEAALWDRVPAGQRGRMDRPTWLEQVFLPARREAMRQRMDEEMGTLDLSLDPAVVAVQLRQRIFPDLDPTESNTGNPVTRIFQLQLEKSRATRELDRFGRAVPADVGPVLRPPTDNATIVALGSAAVGAGFVDYPPPRDGIIRGVPLWMEYRGRLVPQFGLAVACRYLGVDPADVELRRDRLVIAPKDGPPREAPLHTYRSERFGEVGYFFDIPLFGTDTWETTFDHPAHREAKQVASVNKVWRVAQYDDGWRKNAAELDRKLGDALEILDDLLVDGADVARAQVTSRPMDYADMDAREAIAKRFGPVALEEAMKLFGLAVHGYPDDRMNQHVKVVRLLWAQRAMARLPALMRPAAAEVAALRKELRAEFEGKTILIGSTATSSTDLLPTSLHGRCPGVLVHGMVYNGIVSGELWTHWPRWPSFVVALVMGVLISWFVAAMPPWASVLSSLSLLAIFLLVNGIVLFDYGDRILDAAAPVAVSAVVWSNLTLRRFIVEKAERERITGRFRSYVDPALVQYVQEHPELARLDGKEAELTVVFTDLAGFTTTSEQLGPKIVEVLNEYMTLMVPIIRKHDGYVNKFLGDGIMFFYNALVPNERHAACAVDTVLEMFPVIDAFNKSLEERGLPTVVMRAGIASGLMIVGDAGAADGSDFTVLGDKVNLAARLEGANKSFGTSIMINERGAELLGDEFVLQPLGNLQVKGKNEGVRVFAPLARRDKATPEQLRLAELSKGIVDAYERGRFADGAALLDAYAAEFGKTKYYKLYHELCENCQLQLPEGFDGRVVLTEK
jgi:class 3 adenylate cyclase/CHASE2 domain-containing sensor protein